MRERRRGNGRTARPSGCELRVRRAADAASAADIPERAAGHTHRRIRPPFYHSDFVVSKPAAGHAVGSFSASAPQQVRGCTRKTPPQLAAVACPPVRVRNPGGASAAGRPCQEVFLPLPPYRSDPTTLSQAARWEGVLQSDRHSGWSRGGAGVQRWNRHDSPDYAWVNGARQTSHPRRARCPPRPPYGHTSDAWPSEKVSAAAEVFTPD